MGLNSCCGFIKYLMILINLIFWLIGLSIVALTLWLFTDPTFLMTVQGEQTYYYVIYIFLGVGLVMVFVAFLGCCGALKESQCMLVSFFCCLLVVLVAEVASGAWAYHNSDKLESITRSTIKKSVQDEYGVVQSRTAAYDTIQKYYECCGAEGPHDWASSVYNKEKRKSDQSVIDLVISNVKPVYDLPASCCKEGTQSDVCEVTRKLGISAKINPVMNSEGCVEKMIKDFKKNMIIVYGIGAGIIGLEFIGLIFSLVLCCAIRRNDDYKA